LRNDMTIGSEWKAILMFSLPIMIGNLLQQLYNTVDGIVVGNYVNDSALAAVGSCTTLSLIFLAIAIGMSNGSTILVAQLFGARQIHELRKSTSTSIIMLVSLGLVFSIFGYFSAHWLLGTVLNVKDRVILDMSVTYFSIYSIGLIFQFTYNIIASILRAIGDSRATLYFLLITASLNAVMDLVFVIVFGWGIAGAAIATVLAQFVCTLVSAIYMIKKYEIFRFTKEEFVFDREKAKICLKLGIPTTLQQCSISFGNVLIQRLVNSFGRATMAAFTVGVRIENYTLIPIVSFNMGMATFTGQNIGAGNIDRIKRGWRATIMMAFGVCAVTSVVAYIFASPLSVLFGVKGESLQQSIEYIRYLSLFFVIFSVYLPTNGVLQGSGDVAYSTLSTIMALIARVAAAYSMAYLFDVGYSSTWKGIPIGWLFAMAIAYFRFFGGKWKTKRLVKDNLEEVAAANG
jgi:putative MATE family efflux protein